MFKKIVFTSLLVAGSAFAQQSTDISGASFQSGASDATLASLGRQAAASGNRLVITAPPEWHAKILAKVRAGGKASVVMRDGFYENVLVRIESATSATSADAEERASKAEVEKSRVEVQKAKAEAERSKVEAAKAKADAQRAIAEAEKAKAEAEAELAKAQAQKRATAASSDAAAKASTVAVPAAAAPRTAPVAVAGTTNSLEASRTRLLQSLQDGRDADGSLPVSALRSGDVLYVDGAAIAVSRREGRRLALYWVEGDLDVRRSELLVVAPNRYQVVSPIRGEVKLRSEFTQRQLDAREPGLGAKERMTLETNLNDGKAITTKIAPAQLLAGDVIYVNGNVAAVVRREGLDLSRFWLVGSMNLSQAGLQADGPGKYKVIADTVR